VNCLGLGAFVPPRIARPVLDAAETVIVRVSSHPLPMDLNLDRMWLRGDGVIASGLAV